jgi:hypothetical protein
LANQKKKTVHVPASARQNYSISGTVIQVKHLAQQFTMAASYDAYFGYLRVFLEATILEGWGTPTWHPVPI